MPVTANTVSDKRWFGRSSRLLRCGVSHPVLALVLTVAGGAFGSAQAATYTAATQTELINAITQANASSDASSTITLTGNLAITNPALIPAVTKVLTIEASGFTLSLDGCQRIHDRCRGDPDASTA